MSEKFEDMYSYVQGKLLADCLRSSSGRNSTARYLSAPRRLASANDIAHTFKMFL